MQTSAGLILLYVHSPIYIYHSAFYEIKEITLIKLKNKKQSNLPNHS